MTTHPQGSAAPGHCRMVLVTAAAVTAALLASSPARAQLDICGCAGAQSLGDFVSSDEATWPAGTTRSNAVITMPMQPGGVFVFDSFTIDGRPDVVSAATIVFTPDAANSPVTLLVAGDVVINTSQTVSVAGRTGTAGSVGLNGVGGAGGPGGFRGGDGAYPLVNLAVDGGAGFGPAGGAGGVTEGPLDGGSGSFVGNTELLPLLGGSGGGGGGAVDDGSGCSAGGGGGGGGALLIAANGEVSIDGTITANGGAGGQFWTGSCAGWGSGGAGGAVRILADRLTGVGSVTAAGGGSGQREGGAGAIRFEAFTNELAAGVANPIAVRSQAPGPLLPPIEQTVAITALQGETLSRVNDQPLATLPQGTFGQIDVLFDLPGTVDIDLATVGVPAGTGVEVSVKPRLGRLIRRRTALLDPSDCDGAGRCTATVTIDIPAGQFLVEARATFQQ